MPRSGISLSVDFQSSDRVDDRLSVRLALCSTEEEEEDNCIGSDDDDDDVVDADDKERVFSLIKGEGVGASEGRVRGGWGTLSAASSCV